MVKERIRKEEIKMEKKNRGVTEPLWDLARVLRLLRDRGWIVAAAAIGAGALFLCAALLFVTPRYRAEALLHVRGGGEEPGLTSSQLMAARELVHTCAALLESRTLLEETAELAGLPVQPEELSGALRCILVEDTGLFRIAAEWVDPHGAALLANAAADALTGQMAELMEGCRVQVVDGAVAPEKVCAPNLPLAAAAGVLAGCALSFGVLAVGDSRRCASAGKEG